MTLAKSKPSSYGRQYKRINAGIKQIGYCKNGLLIKLLKILVGKNS